MTSTGFIGGGRVTRILFRGWARAAALPAGLLVHEPDDAAFEQLLGAAPHAVRASLQEAAATDVVFLALHPPKVADTLAMIKRVIGPKAMLVSLAPKLRIEQLAGCSGTSRIARVIPNAASVVGEGYNPVAFGPALDAHDRATLMRLFEPLGETPEVEEVHLEAYAILTAMGPTYFWFQWQALREIAEELGLGKEQAELGLRAMLTGAMATLFDSGLSAAEVMDLVPVKPLGPHEAELVKTYHDALTTLHAKLAPLMQQPTPA